MQVDLTHEAEVESSVNDSAADHGGIDVLVNAGAFAVLAPIDTMTFADWKLTLSAELGLFSLRAARSGRI